jgi:hypothetical protein
MESPDIALVSGTIFQHNLTNQRLSCGDSHPFIFLQFKKRDAMLKFSCGL